VSFRIWEGVYPDILHAVRTGDLDFAICLMPDRPRDETLNFVSLVKDRLVSAVHSDHPLIGVRKRRLADLIELDWIIYCCSHSGLDVFEQTFIANRLAPPKSTIDASDKLVTAILRRPYGFEIILQDDLVHRLIKALTGKPGAVALRPVLPAGVVAAAMAQQERKQLSASPHELHRRVETRAGEIAYRFVPLVRHLDACQIAGSMQDRELLGVAPIRLDALARFARDHRGRDHCAAVAEFGEMAVHNSRWYS
jgi:DNA-binding transcriptional LysR family regulator